MLTGRCASPIDRFGRREQPLSQPLQAVTRDGLRTPTAPQANTVSTVTLTGTVTLMG